MADVNLKDVNKIYKGNVHAVIDFNLSINDREFVIFVGPSGCGKSTTLRMIAGLEEITSGEIRIGDRVVNDLNPKDRDIAMVFQNYALYPHMSVYDNMAFGLKLRKASKSEIKQKVTEAAEILGITELLERKPRALSGGQRQRVALGRSIVRQPTVFLMDEPLSNLDAKLRVQMRTEISKLHQKLQTTFIYVTHDQTEAMTMADRIVVMKDGVIHQVDTPHNIYENPVNMFVASFIGSPQMNFLNVRLDDGGKNLILESQNISIPMPVHRMIRLPDSAKRDESFILGIRPEHLVLDSKEIRQRQLPVFHTITEVSETMGAESFLYLKHKKGLLTARVNGNSPLKPGEPVELAFDPEKIHLFEPSTHQNLL